MKVEIKFPQIRAVSVTHPKTMNDEIYLAYFVTLVKKENGPKGLKRKYVMKCVSDIQEKVKKGKIWTPDDLASIVDTGDAEAMFLTFALYEADDERLYNKLIKEADLLLEPEDFDWSELEIPNDITSWMAWLKAAWKLIRGSYNYFKQDDHFGTRTIEIHDFHKKGWRGYREFNFKAMGGHYEVTMHLNKKE